VHGKSSGRGERRRGEHQRCRSARVFYASYEPGPVDQAASTRSGGLRVPLNADRHQQDFNPACRGGGIVPHRPRPLSCPVRRSWPVLDHPARDGCLNSTVPDFSCSHAVDTDLILAIRALGAIDGVSAQSDDGHLAGFPARAMEASQGFPWGWMVTTHAFSVSLDRDNWTCPQSKNRPPNLSTQTPSCLPWSTRISAGCFPAPVGYRTSSTGCMSTNDRRGVGANS